MEVKFDFNDILIEPSAVSYVDSRTKVNILDENGMLPIFTAPMFDVVSEDNSDVFNMNRIYSIIPRKSSYNVDELITNNPKKFIALGLDDFINLVINTKLDINVNNKAYILIDIANGNMIKLVKSVKKSKDIYGDNLILMVGNIANPDTYAILSEAGADLCRCGVGNGSSCTTSANVSIGYPLASLIKDTYEKSLTLKKPAKIIADGGIKSFSDALKSLALGADLVMMGGILNKSLESSGNCYKLNEHGYIKITNEEAKQDLKIGIDVYKQYKGMSTKESQRQMGSERVKTSEGIVKYNKVEYTLSGWVENFNDYLKSTMSYCGKFELNEFIGKVKFNMITYNSFLRYNK